MNYINEDLYKTSEPFHESLILDDHSADINTNEQIVDMLLLMDDVADVIVVVDGVVTVVVVLLGMVRYGIIVC